jgi:hypothetical protein
MSGRYLEDSWRWCRSAFGQLAEIESDQVRLIRFIKERLRSESRENGRKLELAGRLSLERIVVYHCPELFDPDDIEWAKATLSGF